MDLTVEWALVSLQTFDVSLQDMLGRWWGPLLPVTVR
jgi:hypothetical protein